MNLTKCFRIILVALLVLPLIPMAISPVFGGTTGIISGTVTDFATGDKLAGVNVIVEGTNLTTVTDANGFFVVTNVPPGEYKVTASLVGYADIQVAKVNVLMDITTTVDCEMSTAVAEEETVVVKESRPMIQRDVIPTTYIVDDEHEQAIRGQALSMYQTPALVSTVPGVVADEYGYPHIRGGRGNDIGYMLDGIPITEPVTNGFATNIVTIGLDKMEIYTGGYRPEYGNAISGVLNQIVKTGRTAPGVSLEMVGGSQAYKGVYPEIGGAGEKFDYYASGYLWHSEFEGLDYNEGDCADFIGKFNYDVNEKNKFTMLVGNGSAKYLFPSSHTTTYGEAGLLTVDEARDSQQQKYDLTALTWTHRMSPAAFFTVRPYYLKNTWVLDAISPDMGAWMSAESENIGLQFDYTNQLSEKHLLKAGAMRVSGNNKYWSNVPEPFPGAPDFEYVAETDTTQTGLYVQDQMKLSPKWRAEAGVRYDQMHYDKKVNEDTSESQWSPRFGVSYAVDSKTNLRFSYGKMIQFAHTQAMERVYNDPIWYDFMGLGSADLKPERNTQYDLGWERQVSNDYSVQVTPFYRKMGDLIQWHSVNPVDATAPPFLFENLGEGTCKGVELLLKKRESDNWSGWVAYTYSKARALASSAGTTVTPGEMMYPDWDQRHTLVAVLNYSDNGWNYSLMGEYGSGLPWTDMSDAIPNTRRVSPHTVVNLNVSREVKGGWLPLGEIRLGVANLFNSREVLDRDYDGSATVTQMPRFVNMSYIRRF